MKITSPAGQDLSFILERAASAREIQSTWAAADLSRRLQVVRRIRHLIGEQADTLDRASAEPRSRPPEESLSSEVLPLLEACRFLEKNAGKILRTRHLGPEGLTGRVSRVRAEVVPHPLGLVLIIGPGNYPLFLPGVQVIQALTAGNAVLLKPGVGGSRAALALHEIALRAGLPPALFTVLPESVEAVRMAIASRPDKVLFTGSASTGAQILAQLSSALIPATMELSGSDAVIVLQDADLDLAVRGLVFGLRLNGGATCISPKRVFVARGIATELEGRLAEAFRHGERKTISGPAAETLRAPVQEALKEGAHFIAGYLDSQTVSLPLILGGVSGRAQILREDLFAPVLSVITVGGVGEAVLGANSSPFALGAGIYTRDLELARRVAASLHAGVITVNDTIVPTADPRLPFGGNRRSGFGRTRGAEGLLELTSPKVITVSHGRLRPAFKRQEPADAHLIRAYIGLKHGSGIRRRAAAAYTFIKNIWGQKSLQE